MQQQKIFSFVMVALMAAAAATSAQAQNRHVRIVNNSDTTLISFYAVNSVRRMNGGGWEEDILGDEVVRSGDSIRINIDDGTGRCLFDLRAVLRGGTTWTRRAFNVCTESTWRVIE